MWDLDNGRATEDNATQYTVGELMPFTVYSFRVVAVNALGMSQPSKESYYMITLRECELLRAFVVLSSITEDQVCAVLLRGDHHDRKSCCVCVFLAAAVFFVEAACHLSLLFFFSFLVFHDMPPFTRKKYGYLQPPRYILTKTSINQVFQDHNIVRYYFLEPVYLYIIFCV